MWIPAAVLLLLLVLTLTAGALISLWRTDWAAGTVRSLWCALILLLPVAGALAWLAVLQRSTRLERAGRAAAVAENSAAVEKVPQPNQEVLCTPERKS